MAEHPLQRAVTGTRWRMVLINLLRGGLLLAVLIAVGRELGRRFVNLDWSQVDVNGWLILWALLLSTVASALPFVSLRFALRSFSPEVPRWLPLGSATWLPSLGKYVPGKLISVVGGFWMLRMLNVSTIAAGIAMFLLNGYSVLIGMLLSLPLVWWPPVAEKFPWAGPACLVLLICGVLGLHPRVVGSAVTFCLRRLKRCDRVYAPRWNDHAVPLGVLVVQFSLQGAALWLVTNAFDETTVAWLPAFVSINALALAVGFLALFAPGGIGVREGILLLVLAPATESAALVVVAIRIVNLLGELILAGLGLAIFLSPIWTRACRLATESTHSDGQHQAAPLAVENRAA